MRRLVLIGTDFAGPPASGRNGAVQGGSLRGRARVLSIRGCVFGKGWTRYADAVASGWIS